MRQESKQTCNEKKKNNSYTRIAEYTERVENTENSGH